MIDFTKYLGEYIVLITNFTKDVNRISGIRNSNLGIEIYSYKKQYICARQLTKNDLRDEDFVTWLNSMWADEHKLKLFINHKRQWHNIQNSPPEK
jgi:hypothetical protein